MITKIFTNLVIVAALSGNVHGKEKPLAPEKLYQLASEKVFSITVYKSDGSTSAGSGVVFGKDTIVTNAHVIEGAVEIEVSKNGKKWNPVYGIFPKKKKDYVLLYCKDLNVEEPLLSFYYEIGNKVYAIGDPLGLKTTFSDGIISQKRVIDGVECIQITTPISPGNSGGGLFNEKGELLGITTFKLADGENLNFAIPIHEIFEEQSERELRKLINGSKSLATRKYARLSIEKIQSLIQECFLFDSEYRFAPLIYGINSMRLISDGRIMELVAKYQTENVSKKYGLNKNGPDEIEVETKFIIPISKITTQTNYLKRKDQTAVHMLIIKSIDGRECIKSSVDVNLDILAIGLQTKKSTDLLRDLIEELIARSEQL